MAISPDTIATSSVEPLFLHDVSPFAQPQLRGSLNSELHLAQANQDQQNQGGSQQEGNGGSGQTQGGGAENASPGGGDGLNFGNPVSQLKDQLEGMWSGFIDMVPQLVIAILVIIITIFLSKGAKWIVGRATSRSGMRDSLQSFFKILASLATWVIGILVAAVIVFPNLTPASLLAGLGLGSVAIGFAFKEMFENFFAGVIILLRQEMRINDFIECEGLEGKIEHIAIRESHIRQTDGQLVIVPNSYLFKNPVTIRTDEDQRRTTVICGVGYGEDVDKAREVITNAVESCDSVITDGRPIQIFAQEFGASSINFEVTWWTGSKPVDIRKSRDQVVAAVKRALDDAGIEIPFPYRTLTFKEPLTVEQNEQSGSGEESVAGNTDNEGGGKREESVGGNPDS